MELKEWRFTGPVLCEARRRNQAGCFFPGSQITFEPILHTKLTKSNWQSLAEGFQIWFILGSSLASIKAIFTEKLANVWSAR
jgi:hypothetical protein